MVNDFENADVHLIASLYVGTHFKMLSTLKLPPSVCSLSHPLTPWVSSHIVSMQQHTHVRTHAPYTHARTHPHLPIPIPHIQHITTTTTNTTTPSHTTHTNTHDNAVFERELLICRQKERRILRRRTTPKRQRNVEGNHLNFDRNNYINECKTKAR